MGMWRSFSGTLARAPLWRAGGLLLQRALSLRRLLLFHREKTQNDQALYRVCFFGQKLIEHRHIEAFQRPLLFVGGVPELQ